MEPLTVDQAKCGAPHRPVSESQITSCIIDASQEERVALISILVFIVPDSAMMFVHLSVNVMLMDGYKHH
jgi:hypothetical protein